MIDMAGKDILPAAMRYTGELARTVNELTAAGVEPAAQKEMLERANILLRQASRALS